MGHSPGASASQPRCGADASRKHRPSSGPMAESCTARLGYHAICARGHLVRRRRSVPDTRTPSLATSCTARITRAFRLSPEYRSEQTASHASFAPFPGRTATGSPTNRPVCAPRRRRLARRARLVSHPRCARPEGRAHSLESRDRPDRMAVTLDHRHVGPGCRPHPIPAAPRGTRSRRHRIPRTRPEGPRRALVPRASSHSCGA